MRTRVSSLNSLLDYTDIDPTQEYPGRREESNSAYSSKMSLNPNVSNRCKLTRSDHEKLQIFSMTKTGSECLGRPGSRETKPLDKNSDKISILTTNDGGQSLSGCKPSLTPSAINSASGQKSNQLQPQTIRCQEPIDLNHMNQVYHQSSKLKVDHFNIRGDEFQKRLRKNDFSQPNQNILSGKTSNYRKDPCYISERKESKKKCVSPLSVPVGEKNLDCKVFMFTSRSPKLQNGRVHPDLGLENVNENQSCRIQSNPEVLIHPVEFNTPRLPTRVQYNNNPELRWKKVNCRNHAEKKVFDKSSQTDITSFQEYSTLEELDDPGSLDSREVLNSPVESISQKLKRRTQVVMKIQPKARLMFLYSSTEIT